MDFRRLIKCEDDIQEGSRWKGLGDVTHILCVVPVMKQERRNLHFKPYKRLLKERKASCKIGNTASC